MPRYVCVCGTDAAIDPDGFGSWCPVHGGDEQPMSSEGKRWTISGVRSNVSPDRALMSVFGPEVIGTVEVVSASEVERLREALKNEIRWNIEGTGIHPDDQEEVIERHYQEALHPEEKEDT